MAGADDVVKAALKLIAGGAKEAGPSVAERAAKNIDVFNTANRLGVDTNDIAKLQETKRLMDYHKGFMGDVKERAKSANEIVQQMKASGAFPMEIGTRYTTEHSRRTGQGPWTVTNYYVDPKNPQGSYGYYVRRELPDGGYEESISKIRDPKLEAMHGPEKWEELQRGFIPMTGPKVVKASGGSIRQGYGPGGWVDDVVKMAGKVISGEGEDAAKAGIRAYHGSPHDFDRFDISKIGTGEGAQAYGHGLYFAEREGVAKGYRDALSSNRFSYGNVRPDDEAIQKFSNQLSDIEQRKARLADKDGFISLDASADDLASLQAEEDKVRNMMVMDTINRNPHLQYGRMYEVNINADPNAFLDWDKPLSEQPQNVLDVARPFFSEGLPERKQYGEIVKGGDLYDMLVQRSGGVMHGPKLDAAGIPSQLPGGTKERLGMYLSSQGIPGIKYLDAGSRSAGDGTRNYVVFDDKLISIIRKYGIAGASAMLGYNLMEQLDPKQALAASMADQDYQASRPQRSMGGNNSISGALNVARRLNGVE